VPVSAGVSRRPASNPPDSLGRLAPLGDRPEVAALGALAENLIDRVA
jgi:hypothetical protein